ncbi:tyrosine--tRNA ligase [Tuberibacillus sp. Marseille-P3662]|uniref:tyrosine--tRNA ligase n=1 Tax=Tuberibacillus sp. Marseille-P3662 TaxID=1965358 RepID=UPI000A1CD992|nr:tyrosine--tRNA ligase [Tuberibacillus sp. Marseille-P3662]
MDIIQDLEARGLIYQTTDIESLKEALKQPIHLYCGFDPTSDSLHVGNLLMIITLRRFQEAGHFPIGLVGGGTGLIGDPSGRTSERQLNEESIVREWGQKIKDQLSRFLDFERDNNPARVVNNYDWLGGLTLVEFLRDTGKHFPLTYMMSKDSVQTRIEEGISYTEFTYMMLQSYDYLNLYTKEKVRLQIGGSDQWGNITAGLELIRRTGHEEPAYGLTVPLITKSDGTKFGKTAGGAIWLDPEKTTPYEFYQFWYNTDDRDVIPFLKSFTFLSLDTIASLQQEQEKTPEQRPAQKALAEAMTRFIHGEDALEQAVKISQALFSGDVKQLSGSDIEQGFKDVPSYTMTSKEDVGLLNVLVEAGVTGSKRQAREDIKNGAIYVNGERIQDMQYTLTADDRIDDQFIILRRGKKKYYLIQY